MKKFLSVLLVLLVAGALAFAGGSDEDGGDTDEGFAWMIETGGFPDVNPLEVEGPIVLAGSSTVFPAAEWAAAQFEDEGYDDVITVDSIGSGGGFERFGNGESMISNASRPIRDSEFETAAGIGREPIEFRIGTDALAVVVNPENTWVSNATIEELAAIMTAENWSDVNPDWPDQPVLKFIPGTDSGTFDYFVEEVFDEDSDPILNSPNVQLSEDDNILVQGIEGSPNAIGFFGYAYYVEEEDRLKILDIEGVTASAEAVDAGDYPLARPLFMYSAASIFEENPQAAAFLAYMLNNATRAMEAVGYFPAPESTIENAKQLWLDAMGM